MSVNPDRADKRGYLREKFRLFHLKDQDSGSIPHHYHEFHKLLLFQSGDLTYRVEGRSYEMQSGDLLLVPAHAIHQPIISAAVPYERFVLWIQPEALEARGLELCFHRSHEAQSYLLSQEKYDKTRLISLLREMERCTGSEFGDEVLAEALFLQAMVVLNRCCLGQKTAAGPESVRSDPKIDEILAYINQDLTADLSVNALAARFYLSRSWLMHRFKAITGCPIHQYVLQKRLILAAQLLRGGESVGEAAHLSGFSDYSAFLRAFRKAYGVSPRDFR